MLRFVNLIIGCLLLAACENNAPLNNPYPQNTSVSNTLYSSFSERPKTLDPARSYSSNEYKFIAQIYEPPIQYHYLKRPYTLVPLSSSTMPLVEYLDAQGQLLPSDTPTKSIVQTRYTIEIQKGIQYQPHPAFAPLLTDLNNINVLMDFPEQSTRELTANDYVHQIKRLAHPTLHSPIYSIMGNYIEGLTELRTTLDALKDKTNIDLTQHTLEGAKTVSRYHYQITIKGKYPQFIYWLAMPFFAPMPPEADTFYNQPGMKEKNLTLDWYPIGTGPYYLTENNPNRRMVLQKNPNFHGETYPALSEHSNQALPFIDQVIYVLEKETIPIWNKFLQGYYDASVISSDNFDQAIQMGSTGETELTPIMMEKNIQLKTAVQTSISYMGFNMKDPIVGGYDASHRALRQAISIAIDYEEYIAIFNNGRGISAQGPIPPSIYGHLTGKEGLNKNVYNWENKPVRKHITAAKNLLATAGYPKGINPKTGKPLVLHFDVTGTGPENKARFSWYRKQLQKLNIQLDIRATDYNRFQEKMRKGNAQLFLWGWNADYPDPENFFFLLDGKNGKVAHQGENAANYNSPEFNTLFAAMKNMDNSPKRQAIITQMTTLVQQDAPWVWGYHPKSYTLHHNWLHNIKPNLMANNTLKYQRLDIAQRNQQRKAWNQPMVWPIAFVLLTLVIICVPAWQHYRRKEQQTAL
ncbi:MAG: ABC transporter substrate-binding protein [Methylococcales bacterium]|jgi:oligopeptide transport system substrate-binding protein|nr:ABC transporter substrate-binding protein [Methylococcales bacterium]MBT7443979.1 ABC transporter substrate-binding protein [Methylococcales bacterium]